MTRALLPAWIKLGRGEYEVIVVSRGRCQWLGFSADCVVRHKFKQIFIASDIPPDERPAVLSQACEEAAVILSAPRVRVA